MISTRMISMRAHAEDDGIWATKLATFLPEKYGKVV